MEKTIKEKIIALADEQYRSFSTALLPGIDHILGVRLPQLRKIAKEIAKTNWRYYLAAAEDEYFEERMLQGMVIGYVRTDIDERLQLTENFVSRIDNWAICDSFCSGLKFTVENREKVWSFLQPYFFSEKEYHVRFALVMLLTYFLVDDYLIRVLKTMDLIRHQGYYAQMGLAWAVSICYLKFPVQTLVILQCNDWDDFTYNKALQKISESKKIDREGKAMIRLMKRPRK